MKPGPSTSTARAAQSDPYAAGRRDDVCRDQLDLVLAGEPAHPVGKAPLEVDGKGDRKHPLIEQAPIRDGLDRIVALGAAMLRAHPDWLGGRDPELVASVTFHSLRGALFRIVATTPEKLDDPDLVDLVYGGARGFLEG